MTSTTPATLTTPRPFVRSSVTMRIASHPAATSGRTSHTRATYREHDDAIALDESDPSVVFARRGRELYRLSLRDGHERLVARDVPQGDIAETAGLAIIASPVTVEESTVSAIDLVYGALRWHQPGSLLAAGNGVVVIAKSNGPTDPDTWLEARDATSGRVRWRDIGVGCAPERPTYLEGPWAVVTWAYACAASANEPFFEFVDLRNGFQHDMTNSTGFLARRGSKIYLTGDDQHYGEYGPGNLAAWKLGARAPYLAFPIAPDAPRSDPDALAVRPKGYVLANALWVQMGAHDDDYANATYRYTLVRNTPPPGRIGPEFGTFTGATDDEAYFFRDERLVKVIARTNAFGDAYPFAGTFAAAPATIAHGSDVYTGTYGDTIRVFDRWTRRETHTIAAACADITTIRTYGTRGWAFCRGEDATTIAGWTTR